MTKTFRSAFLTTIFVIALFIFAIVPTATTYVAHSSSITVAATSDPIAIGNWQYDQYDSTILQMSQANGLNPFVIKGQMMLESNFNPNALSPWGDQGLMQIKYATAQGLGYSGSYSGLFDPWTNIYYGTMEMEHLMWQFGDINLALQAYNIGSYGVENGQRNWAYSDNVMAYANQFQSEHNNLYGSTSMQSSSSSTGGDPYTVQPGDTLSIIAIKYGISYQAIAQSNGISYPYLIFVGESLNIPSASGGGGSWTYTVQSGDTLSAIGARYGVAWQSIASDNGISWPYLIFVGEHITIP